MDLITFEKSLLEDHAPPGINAMLLALWNVAKGDWKYAHELVQDEPGRDAAWIHAYLHRLEGDNFNAKYWYSRAGKESYSGELVKEWKDLAQHLLDNE